MRKGENVDSSRRAISDRERAWFNCTFSLTVHNLLRRRCDPQKRRHMRLSPKRIPKAISVAHLACRLAQVIEHVLQFGGSSRKLIISTVHWPHYVRSHIGLHGHALVIGTNVISSVAKWILALPLHGSPCDIAPRCPFVISVRREHFWRLIYLY